jgi:predicted DsbA family dithiol-disulfide isomerase
VTVDVTLFTDPACPFAFSAEPVRWALRRRYGDALRWTTRMIVLTREPGEAEKLAQGAPGLQRRHGMPIDPRPLARPASSEPACRAFVAARLHVPGRADALLRRLRVNAMLRGLLDDPGLLRRSAEEAGIDAAELERLAAGEDVAAALEEDAAAARHPLPAARALDHRLGGPPEERRYTAPSYVIGGWAIPGFNPLDLYELAIANVAPDLRPAPPPASVTELLAWAGEPLATAEVAVVLGIDRAEARAALEDEAVEHPAGADAYWTVASAG